MRVCSEQLVGPVALFLAAKVEEQPRKLDHIIYAVHRVMFREVSANPLAEAVSHKPINSTVEF